MRRLDLPVLALLALAAAPGAASGTVPGGEQVRRFIEGGPALLLSAAERGAIESGEEAARLRAIEAFLDRDPVPATPENELRLGIERRRELVARAGLSPYDDRARLLFLRGAPDERKVIDCAAVFRQLELWRWGAEPGALFAVLYRPGPGQHYRVWRPTDSKRVLYSDEMEYLLEQLEELRGRVRLRGKRPDRAMCEESERIDAVTGVDGLFGFERDRLRDRDVEALFAAPADLAAWAVAAAATPLAEQPALPEPELRFGFPERREQRLLTRFRLELPPDAPVEPAEVGLGRELRLLVSGVIDRPDGVFEEFRNRFVFAVPAPGTPIVLVAERLLRPHERFVARLEVVDETSGRRVRLVRGFEVPGEPVPEPEPLPEAAVVGEDLGLTRLVGRDTVVLLPPAEDVVQGLFRAEAIVAGERIRRVAFLVDGKTVLTRGAPPWSAELRLPLIPREVIVGVQGLDAQGEVIAADEILLNEPQGEPRIRLLQPERGAQVSGTVHARAAVVAPEGKRVERVEFKLGDSTVAVLERPPWEADVEVPPGGAIAFLTVTATYQDGTVVEDFRVLNASEFVEQIEVDLVEVYTTVTDRVGNPVDGLGVADFEVRDNGRPQAISKFELVRDLPLTLGVVLDTSGSMGDSIAEAKKAASEFLTRVMTPKDRCLAIAFSERPALLMPLTSDARAVDAALRDQPALGSTSLHDALVFALYQYRGVRGRRAMVLLSDGDDTSSLVAWEDALAYAERTGVAIYTIGLGIGPGSISIRGKLEKLAEETGGRTFFVDRAEQLAGVYEQIERELRSQYLLAFAPDPAPKEGERHALEVLLRDRSLTARAARGYTP